LPWRGNDGNCCPNVEDIDCATYVPFEYYKAQKNSDGSSQCWITGYCDGDSEDTCHYDDCNLMFELTDPQNDRQYSNIPVHECRMLWYQDGQHVGCPKCNMFKDSDAHQNGLPYSVKVTNERGGGQCATIDGSAPMYDRICPASYQPIDYLKAQCAPDYHKVGDQCCLNGKCPTSTTKGTTTDDTIITTTTTTTDDTTTTKDTTTEGTTTTKKTTSTFDTTTTTGDTTTTTKDTTTEGIIIALEINDDDGFDAIRQGQGVERNTGFEGSDGLQVDGPSDNNNEDVDNNDDVFNNNGDVNNNDDVDNNDDDKNDEGFPLWLLILIIVLAVLAALIAAWLIYRCCKKEPESDIEEASSDGIYGERDSFVAACANSEMQVMTGIAVADGAKTHISAVDPNWNPSDDSITARRTTPSPDRSNVIRQGQVVEYV